MAKLKAATRNRLPASAFGLPGQRKYPMEDKTHQIKAEDAATNIGFILWALPRGKVSRRDFQRAAVVAQEEKREAEMKFQMQKQQELLKLQMQAQLQTEPGEFDEVFERALTDHDRGLLWLFHISVESGLETEWANRDKQLSQFTGRGKSPLPKQGTHMERPRPITLAAAAATLLVAIFRWASNTSSRVASLEANQAAHEQRLAKAEKDADQYRQDTSDIRDRISRIEGYLKRLTQ